MKKETKWLFVVAAGGVTLGSDADFVVPWLRKVFGYLGVSQVKVLAVGRTLFPGFDIKNVEVDFK